MPPAWLHRHVAFGAGLAALVACLLALPLVLVIRGALGVLGLADGLVHQTEFWPLQLEIQLSHTRGGLKCRTKIRI